MNRIAGNIVVGAVLSLGAAAQLAQAQAPPVEAAAPAGTVHVRCRVGVPSGVTEPMTMSVQLYRVGRDNLGNYKLAGESQNLFLNLTPGAGGTGSGIFDAELSSGKDVEYELKVVPLDRDGNERTDGRYYFVSPDATGDFFEKTVSLRPGEINEIAVDLKWLSKAQQYKSNFLQVVPRPGRTDYFLALFVNDPTDIDLMN